MSEGRSVSLATLTAVAVIALDELSKALVRDELPHGEERDLAFGAHLVHVENDGVAFGRLGGNSGLVALVVGAALVGLIVYFARHRRTPLIWLPTGLLLGGALGNILDRIGDGSVTDFVKLPRWPAFNVADIAVTAGVVLLLVVIELQARREKASAEASGPKGAEGDGAAGRA